MADNNQIAILSQGVEAWNKWREENPDVLIDLKNAKLMHMNLENANLAKADDQKIMWKLTKATRWSHSRSARPTFRSPSMIESTRSSTFT